MQEDSLRIAVLVTSYNRVNVTLRCLGLLLEGFAGLDTVAAEVFLVDDKSPDGTGDKVRECFNSVHVIEGTGQLFWNGGMCLAFAKTMGEAFDAYLLFNDDSAVHPERVTRFISDFVRLNQVSPAILVGPMTSVDGKPTYAGFRRVHRLRPLSFAQVLPNGALQRVDAFNGNFVLIPGAFMRRVGGLDPGYRHSYGDLDLGLMAKKEGIGVILWSQPVGVCDRNPPLSSILKGQSFYNRLKYLFLGKNHISQYIHFCWKHMPKVLFPGYVILYSVRIFFTAIKKY